MPTMNDISLKILLALYKYNVIEQNDTSNLIFSFFHPTDDFDVIEFSINETKANNLENLCKNIAMSDRYIFLAINYLSDEEFISFRKDGDNQTDIYLNLRLTSNGIKIIEGVNNPEYKKVFENHFHISLAENINLDSLIQGKLGLFNN
jgi:hypothetical protein